MLKSPAQSTPTTPLSVEKTKNKLKAQEAHFSLNAKDKYFAWIFLGPSLFDLRRFHFLPNVSDPLPEFIFNQYCRQGHGVCWSLQLY